MHFKISKNAQSFFGNIMNLEGYTASEDKRKFIQFDVYYCCALIGMAAGQRDDTSTDLKDIVDKYPNAYKGHQAEIAGLLVTTEAKRLGIDVSSPKLEDVLLKYLSSNSTSLSDEGVKALNAYSLRGYQLIADQLLGDKPNTREEFLHAFYNELKKY